MITKFYPIFMLIVGYLLGVFTARFMFKECFKRYTEEISAQYKKLLKTSERREVS